ncbi:MAG TPA: hypothetical protein VKB36_18910 [Vicinamibacterales bacterium]|nr:hypothetical protein [Vicinamibacterales bacterium]
MELRFLSNGHWFASQSAGSREVANLCASTVLDDLIADGWLTASSDDPWIAEESSDGASLR